MANIDDLAAGARRLIQRSPPKSAAEELQQYELEQAGMPRRSAQRKATKRAVALLELCT